MERLKKFIEARSKILFISFLISCLLFILILPEFLHYSDYIRDITTSNNLTTNMTDATIGEIIWSTHATETFKVFSIIASSVFVFILLFNLVGYLFRKNEFIFMSVGLSIIITCMSVYLANSLFIISIMLATILNIIGYIDQYNLGKKGE